MGNRLLLVGLDGFETTIAERLIKEGRMPVLQKIMANAARVDLDHGDAKRTGLAWEHFASGLSPESAHRWSAINFDINNYECIQMPSLLPAFPSNLDVKTVVFDPPYFNMKDLENISGLVNWGAHDPGVAQSSNPPRLVDEVLERFGPYPAKKWIYGHTWPNAQRTEVMGASLVDAVKQRAEITRWLLKDRLPDWDLGIVVIAELHSAIEAFWHGIDPSHPLHKIESSENARIGLEAIYEAVDNFLGVMIESFPEISLLCFSMHGMGANNSDVSSMVLLPEFLYRRHFGKSLLNNPDLSADAIPQHAPKVDWSDYVKQHMNNDDHGLWDLIRRRINRKLSRLKKKADITEEGTYNPPIHWMPVYWYQAYWEQMPVFALPSFNDGIIRLNVRGREACGFIETEEYDSLCKQIADELHDLVDPRTSCPVVKEIHITHPGDPMSVSSTEADIVVVWAEAALAFQTKDKETIGPFAYRRPGGHTGGYGISLWHGGDFDTCDNKCRSSFDVVPTVIEYLLDEQSKHVDGESFLTEIRV